MADAVNWTYRCEYVRCGHGCQGCPHGPYWYGYRRAGKRTLKKYIGKIMPDDARERADNPTQWPDYWARIFSRETATVAVAKEILGVAQSDGLAACRAAFRRLTKRNRPDEGRNDERLEMIRAAWSYLNALAIW